ncbi:MAG: hypothetical protein JWR87_2548 [Segetibacter sp.]|jgi:hypothetical protein|nr:hypothetical protein [Segetibacter sp.]
MWYQFHRISTFQQRPVETNYFENSILLVQTTLLTAKYCANIY